jgi:hypothetical protein
VHRHHISDYPSDILTALLVGDPGSCPAGQSLISAKLAFGFEVLFVTQHIIIIIIIITTFIQCISNYIPKTNHVSVV